MVHFTEEVNFRVKVSYDQIAEEYLRWVESRPSPRLRILELGCGAGVPVTQYLGTKVGETVANDLSTKQLEFAKEEMDRERSSCGNAQFIASDMLDLAFPVGSFDVVVAFFSLFHLPVSSQRDMVARLHSWIKPGCYFVCNAGASADTGTWDDFFGAEMFWANAGTDGTLRMIYDAGFEILDSEVIDGTEGLDAELAKTDPNNCVKFAWIIAKKLNWE